MKRVLILLIALLMLSIPVLANNAPVINSYSPELNIIMYEGDNQIFLVNASDPDGFIQYYSWEFSPLLPYDPTGKFKSYFNHSEFQAGYLQAGNYKLVLTVIDDLMAETKMEWNIIVLDSNGPPIIGWPAPNNRIPIEVYFDHYELKNSTGGLIQSIPENNVKFQVNSSDPEWDTLIVNWDVIKNNLIIYSEHKEIPYSPDAPYPFMSNNFNYTFDIYGTYYVNVSVDDGQYHRIPSSNPSTMWVVNVRPSCEITIPDERFIIYREFTVSCSGYANETRLFEADSGIEICKDYRSCTGMYVPQESGTKIIRCETFDNFGNLGVCEKEINIYSRESIYVPFVIDSYFPQSLDIIINAGSSQLFTINASNENLTYDWRLYKNNGVTTVPSDIIFTRDEKEIFSMNPDGTNLKQLTFRPSDHTWSDGGAIYDEYPVLAKDGKIVFARKDGDIAFHGAYQIWSMNLDGSRQTKLTDWFTVSTPPNVNYIGKPVTSTSLSDSSIYYNVGGYIWKMNLDGTNQESFFPPIDSINPNGNLTKYCLGAKVSWDGTKIVCINNKKLVEMMNSDGTNEINLTTNSTSLIYYDETNYMINSNPYTYPNWNFDGTRITYVLDGGQLWSINLDGSDPQLLINKNCINAPNLQETINCNISYRRITDSCWLSDHEIVYGVSGEIYKKDLLTENITQLTFKDPNFMATLWDQQVSCRPIIKQNLLLIQQSSTDKFTFSPVTGDSGNYTLKLNISDGLTSNNLEWNIKVDPYVAPSAPTGPNGGSNNHPPLVTSTVQETRTLEQPEIQEQPSSEKDTGITGAATAEIGTGNYIIAGLIILVLLVISFFVWKKYY